MLILKERLIVFMSEKTIVELLKEYKNSCGFELSEKINTKKTNLDYDALLISRKFIRCFNEFKCLFNNSEDTCVKEFIINNLKVFSQLVDLNMDYSDGNMFGDYMILQQIKKITKENYFIIQKFFMVYMEIKES